MAKKNREIVKKKKKLTLLKINNNKMFE